jgi:hypothetical protein
LGLRIIAPTARIIPRIIWGESRAAVGFPTVVCVFDKTIGFHLERVHVLQAMVGRETLHFEVSNDPAHEPRLLGTRYGKKAALTRQDNTSISAVAVMRQPSGSALVIDPVS